MVELPEIRTVFVNGALCHGHCENFRNMHILSLESFNFKCTEKWKVTYCNVNCLIRDFEYSVTFIATFFIIFVNFFLVSFCRFSTPATKIT
jgi:hypothetical protein